ncbi:YeeE/YedE family protein [Arthrobacter sp. zg-Y20]|uniref:YeeE/YedE family protein n=1 Tax=unclassified Arthrobacter TaxID=235627 RepID=UPI001D1332D2|nr:MULTISPECIES: YeeE/YedE family protein [unclassified Arthrobacter]MCC3274634.1 YeeE/YedE family protein [Arthrobacter sp. zg-Y20]MDK1314791.1 YeeE/YedE family protein [Arthrobacter sp. zg.Y20]MDK1327653.1 YeeE/YedE family protein [Arthrobacter sp. zg-Y1143]WIB04655.1 YeeE/YedE family protein [Arthrobacter sp. zg-Y20]
MLISGLLVGVALGFVMQRGRFCVTGAFRDVWVTRSTRWLTAFLVVVAVQSVGVFALDAAGVISLSANAFPWLATIIGGFIFGFAIVLAGGCATGTYYRAGEGLVGSWFALAAYALFAAIMKTGPLSGFNTAMRSVTVEQSNFYSVLGVSPWLFVALLVAGVGLAVRHHLRKPKIRLASLPPAKTGLAHLLFEKPWNAFATAVVIGLIAIAAWPLSWATGRQDGLGITTPSSKLVGYLVTGDPELVDWGVFLVIGILLGSYIAAKGSGEFRVRVPDAATVLKSLGGGALMGIGAALAGGCTIGNAMVQTAQFSFQGWTALVFMILGTGLAAKLTILNRRSAPAPARVPAGV